MKNKPKLQYRAVEGKHPTTHTRILRPQICNRETYYIEQVIDAALERGYIRGQYEDSVGTFRGALECVKKLGTEGKAVNLGFFRVHSELTGQLDETRQLTSANELHVAITALQDLKADISDFSWSRIDDSGVIIKVEKITSPNGNAGEITRGKAIVANGKNLAYNADWGDKVTVSHDGLLTPIELTPSEQSETYLRFEWPSALDSVAVGTQLMFVFRLHGAAGAAEQPSTLMVKLVEGVTPPTTTTITKVTQAGRADDDLELSRTHATVIHGTLLNLDVQGGDKVKIELYKEDGTTLHDQGDCTSKITANTSDSITLSGFEWENEGGPDGDWYEVYPRSKVVVIKGGVRYEHPATFKGS